MRLVFLGVICVIGSAAAVATRLGSEPANKTPPRLSAAETEARNVCGTACHQFPPPDILPRSAWAESVAKMTLFRAGLPEPKGEPGTLARTVTLPEDMQRVLKYYEVHAPASIPLPASWPAPDGRGPGFVRRPLAPMGGRPAPAIANVRFADLDGDARLELLACDMRQGLVMRARPYDPNSELEVIGEVPHPAHVEVIDLDRDGVRDLLVADLGEYYPGEHEKGALVWLRGLGDGRFANHSIGGLPRVADVQAADVDADGDHDLIVGAFGWRKIGHITLYENGGITAGKPSLTPRRLDDRTGAIHVPPVDLNRDGRIDFVALVSQQHETVVAFLNDGKGGFRQEVIYAAPHPNWGSSGIHVVDLDRDGDLDVLFTNGDTFDDYVLKPYHGITWLENKGTFPFTAHTLATLAGVHRAIAGDFDGDGDLDIVASALVVLPPGQEAKLPSLVWLEQVKPGRFERHTLEMGLPAHATIDAADFDLDGDLDLVVGNFANLTPMETWVEIWENQTVNAKPSK
jgi:hypothetical protein